ncbi:hypothetical protein HN014_22340 (plasmid) [Aquimarina sp. TRL1]|uniref:hypothetical protein n=1 Tax=Aquimarina sp. (strain TRL1) TaxID=2736252 RepID=UPI00158CD484|nr:hypothetical protein [Aquimarina sp. TRL1]QKX07742.1 hypothetical protein HN014_22340 [Aquimarina sp. TRL1]
MGKIIDSKVKAYVKNLLEGSIENPKTIAKLAILSDRFYDNIKESLDLSKVPFTTRRIIVGNFINFIVQFETLCVKAYKPSGSGSTADDVISLYSRMQRENAITNIQTKTLIKR